VSAPAREAGPRPLRVARFLGWYLGRFVRASVEVVREVVTPGTGVRPAVVRHRLRCRTDLEVASFVALVGLTPGSLVVGTDDHADDRAARTGRAVRTRERRPAGTRGSVAARAAGRAEIAVHVMDAPDAGAALAELVELEDRMLDAFRRRGRRAPAAPDAGGAR